MRTAWFLTRRGSPEHGWMLSLFDLRPAGPTRAAFFNPSHARAFLALFNTEALHEAQQAYSQPSGISGILFRDAPDQASINWIDAALF